MAAAPTSQIGVQSGQFVEDPRYHADPHQHLLAGPNRWCEETRPQEPLLADAIRIATGDANEPLAAFGATHRIPMMNRGAIVAIRDESICERAAKAYDRAVHSGELLNYGAGA